MSHRSSTRIATEVRTRPPAWLQRRCACGAGAGLSGHCEDCARAAALGLQSKAQNSRADSLEREADATAARVIDQGHSAGGPLQRLPTLPRPAAGQAPPAVDTVLATPGRALDDGVRQDMEQRFGVDFGQVRVHAGADAASAARAVDAQAFTAGAHLVFGAGRYTPATREGRQLLAHELAHVAQQARRPAGTAPLQRKGFDSTVEICHRVLQTRTFDVKHGGVRVALTSEIADASVPGCHSFDYGVTLTQSKSWWPDQEISTCMARSGGIHEFSFARVPNGSYYLTIWRTFDNPNCCLQGDISVYDEAQTGDGEGCRRPRELSAMDIVHGALDLAGFIPVLGAIPDGINAAIYVVEGDWTNAGLSAVAMIPAWGDGIKLTTMAGKSVLRVEAKAAMRLGEEGLAKELKAAKALSKPEAKVAKEAEKDAKALDEAFKGGKGEGAYNTTQRLARGNLGERLATDALAADGHRVLHFKPDIRGTNQGGIDMLTMKGDTVFFVDNKALTRGGNVSSVSALTTNFAKNKAAALADLKAALAAAPTQAEREVLDKAVKAIESGNFKRVVTNANLAADDKILSGVTDTLSKQGIGFIDVFKPLGKKP